MKNSRVLTSIGGAIFLAMFSLGSAHAFSSSDFALHGKCTEADGSFKWEVQNGTSQVVPFTLRAVDNDGADVSGQTLPSGQGNGDSPDRTITYSSRSSGGTAFRLEIAGFSYEGSASASSCSTSSGSDPVL